MSCARLREWVRTAQPGARLVYGYGGIAAHACSSSVRELVMALYEKGLLTPHRTKLGTGLDAVVAQIVVRTAKPVLKGDPLEMPKAAGERLSREDRDAALSKQLFKGAGR